MSLAVGQSDYFWADLLKQVDWYRDHAASAIAERYVDAVETTLQELTKTPGIGRLRFKTCPSLPEFVPGGCKNLTMSI